MRRLALPILLLLAAACSSTPPTGVEPPPPPPASTPASVVVQAGDGQQAAPGAAVLVNPTVIVKNAAGAPVAGVTVTFSVDSGGGTISGGTAVTNASGVATVGSWTLGPAAGRNVLRIVVSGLAPLFAAATVVVPISGRIADVAIGAGGGTITSSAAPLAGMALTIPAGAYTTSGQWTVDFLPSDSGPKSPNFRVSGPVVAITTTQGMANQLITLKLPVVVSSDSVAISYYYDPDTGYLEQLPIVASDANSITLGTRHFNAALLPERPAGSLRAILRPFAALSAPGSRVIVVTTMQSAGALAAQVPAVSDFVPGTDDWEFGDHGSYLTPDGNSTGVALSELYFYFLLKPLLFTGPPLSGKYSQHGFWADDRYGYRIAALAETDVNWPQAASIIQSMSSAGDGAEYHALLGAIAYSKRPSLISMSGPSGTVALVAYQVNANEVLAADPNNPGQAVHIRYIGNQFQPVQFPGCGGSCPRSFTTFHTIGVSSLVNAKSSAVATRFAQLPAGPVGAQEFPAYTLQYYDQVSGTFVDLTTTTLEVGWQNLQLRAKCFACEQTLPGGMAALNIYDGGGNFLAGDQTQGYVQFTVPAGNATIGVHVLGGVTDPLGSGTVWRHVDFQYITVSSSKLSITPNPANGLTNVPLTLMVSNLGTTPVQARYIWNFNDGNVATIDNINTVSHPWTGPGVYPVSVVVKDIVTGATVGSATSTVQIDQPVPVWRFDTYVGVGTGFSGPPGATYISAIGDILNDANFIDGLPTCPGCGLIVYQATPVTAGLNTYQPGLYLQWANIGFPRTGFDPVTAQVRSLILGGGAGSLTGGSYVGQSIESMVGTLGPGTVWSINAVKNGNQLTGTIIKTQHIWDTYAPGGAAFVGDDIWSYHFTATRIQ